MFRKNLLILQLKRGSYKKEHPSFPKAIQLPHIQICHSSQRAETIGVPHSFKAGKKLEKHFLIHRVTTVIQMPQLKEKSVLELLKGCSTRHVVTGPAEICIAPNHCCISGAWVTPAFGTQCTSVERHPKETSASATYMVVELLGHFWCHQSHFHPCPHTNNIHC